jgi:hypothetical protein
MGWVFVLALVATDDEPLNHKAPIATLHKLASVAEEVKKHGCQPNNPHPEGNKKN